MNEISESIADIRVRPELPIIDAVEVLNNGHIRIILIVDDEDRLLGVVTDSNIRRAILRKIDFDEPVSQIMVTSPVTAKTGTGDDELRDLMERTGIHEIPLIDDDGRVRDICLIDKLLQTPDTREKVAVVMAGGLGTRLKPLTNDLPKPLLVVGDKPILFTLLDQLIVAGFDTIYLTVNYLADKICDAVGEVEEYKRRITFIHETDRLGTAGALSLLPERPTQPFLVLNGDLLTNVGLNEILRFHSFERNLITLALKEERFTIPYGVASVEGSRVTALHEKPHHLAFVNTGVYVLDPVILDQIPAGEYLDMPDVVTKVLDASLRVGSFPIHEYWLDIGQPEQLKIAQSEFEKHF